ncbi:uncharacterized protein LOC110246479 [Exaiptasia diaphana]|uniref:Uncharacterized protein n=1 Tax=Exaiptasia diaphana TaxID=2652724 RepID=A0A913XRB1_EXADI|nr:uncharacterized protein LOC110246479 [Exaiptasia diaphana]XP_020908486.1 uncharacterized protein LOC110246479 [Exaiptasia diaphana]
MIFVKIVTICLISMFAASVIASRSRRQVVNCTPQEIQELISMGIDIERSTIDCSVGRSRADKNSRHHNKVKAHKDQSHTNCIIDANGIKVNPYEGQYCCSPSCDRYAKHMFCIKPKFIEC